MQTNPQTQGIESSKVIQPEIQLEKQLVEQVVGKKSKWWLWLIIVLVVISLGIGIYFWLF